MPVLVKFAEDNIAPYYIYHYEISKLNNIISGYIEIALLCVFLKRPNPHFSQWLVRSIECTHTAQ